MQNSHFTFIRDTALSGVLSGLQARLIHQQVTALPGLVVQKKEKHNEH